MTPTVIEEDFLGEREHLADWAHQYVTNHFHRAVPTGHDYNKGPVGDLYTAKLMECTEIEDMLDDMIAPGLVA